jgi:hypothetical protein
MALVMAAASSAPQPWGLGAFWTSQFIYALIGEWINWRRLRLKYFVLGGVAATVAVGLLALQAWQGYRFDRDTPWEIIAAFLSLVALVPFSILMESRVNSESWQAWTRRMDQRPTIWEMLTFRHVPDLRAADRSI